VFILGAGSDAGARERALRVFCARHAEFVDGHPERPGGALDVELGALQQLRGKQAGARVATRVRVAI
jgi:hypothetical protein